MERGGAVRRNPTARRAADRAREIADVSAGTSHYAGLLNALSNPAAQKLLSLESHAEACSRRREEWLSACQHGNDLWDTLQLWQSDNSASLTSAPTRRSAQNNASFKSRKKPALSSRHFLNSGRRIAGAVLAAAKVPYPRVRRHRQPPETEANESNADARCRRRHGRGLAKRRRRGGRSRRRARNRVCSLRSLATRVQ